MLERYQEHCENLQRTGNYRELLAPGPSLTCLDFSTNDYLGLSRHPDVLSSGYVAAQQYGHGATGSRLLSGNATIFRELEKQIALDKKTEAALVFNSGFQANTSALSALLNPTILKETPLVFFDRLNHASLYQAVFLSQAKLIRYRHLDYNHLAECLNTYRDHPSPKFIVTETLFGMDGDIVSLPHIFELARQYQALVYLDEAHAVGLLGQRGYGVSTTLEHDIPCVVMGTLSKAVGCAGAYVAASQHLIHFLINSASGFIFSTALSPFVVGAALCAWKLIPSFQSRRQVLFDLAEETRALLVAQGFDVGRSKTHIIPMIIGDVHRASQLYHQLLSGGVRLSYIRRPTVPPKGERLRIALNVSHTLDDVLKLQALL
jgi:8-amino-7-oxononanoate synthase